MFAQPTAIGKTFQLNLKMTSNKYRFIWKMAAKKVQKKQKLVDLERFKLIDVSFESTKEIKVTARRHRYCDHENLFASFFPHFVSIILFLFAPFLRV